MGSVEERDSEHKEYSEHRHHSEHSEHSEHRHHSEYGEHSEHRHHSEHGEHSGLGHHSGHSGHSEHSRHSKHRKHSRYGGKKNKPLMVITIILTTLVAIVVVVIVAALIMRSTGKRKLYAAVNDGGLELPIVVEEPTDDNGDVVDAHRPLKAGEIYYNNKIYKYNGDILTFLMMGVDATGEMPAGMEDINYVKGGQSDAMFLLVMNPHTNGLSLIALNRNTMTNISVYDEDGNYMRTQKAQLCLQHGFGDGKELSSERAVMAVSSMLFQLPIQRYITVHMEAMEDVTNAVGVVDITLDADYPPMGFSAGETVHITGDQVNRFLRYRSMDEFDSATVRMNRNKLYLNALMKSIKSATANDIRFPVTLYSTISPYMVTNISVDEVAYLASELLGYSLDSIKSYSLPGEAVMGVTYEEFHLDEEALQDMMIDIFYEIVED